MFIFDKKMVRKTRIRHSKYIANQHYDNFLANIVYEDLIDRLKSTTKEYNNILELGYKTPLLKQFIENNLKPSIYILSNYINNFPTNSENVILDPENFCFKSNSFDLITSVLDFHHINDLPGALIQINNALKANGLFIASLFAENTLFELKQSMLEAEIALNLPVTPHIFPFATIQDLGSLLQRAKFRDVIVDNFVINVSYDSAVNLMHDLRKMGESNIMFDRSKLPLSRRLLYKIDEIYKNNFISEDKSIRASFNIATITGIK